jgi:transposase
MPSSHPRWKEIDEKLDQDDHARIVVRQIDRLDRQQLDQLYRGVGSDAYDPLVLLKMVLYQYLKGRRSPATWFEEASLNEAMQWIGFGYTPSRRTWYAFRDRVGGVIEDLHEQLIHRGIDEGLVDPTTGVQDGTFVAACASRHRMVNQTKLQKRQEILTALSEGSLEKQDEIPKWVPPTLSGREDLARRMEVAAEVLAARIAKNQAKPKSKRKDSAKITVSLTDPEAPLGRDKLKTYRPLYTIQYVVDPVSYLTISYQCEASTNDAGSLAPMIDKTQGIVGGALQTMLADGAYCSILDLQDAADRNVELLAPVPANGSTLKRKAAGGGEQIPRDQFTYDEASNTYTCPAGEVLKYQHREKKQRQGDRVLYQSCYRCAPSACASCAMSVNCLGGVGARKIKRLEGEELIEAQNAKMQQEDVKARYRVRGQTVERGFGDAKGNRHVVRFHGRGLARARAETGLLVLAQNLLLLDKRQRNAVNPYEKAA